MLIRHRLWRWFCYSLASGAALLIALLVGAAWLLSGQRYQPFLTRQLGALLGAEVSVVSSRLSFRHGLGIQLDTVTVRDSTDTAPFFAADRIDVLLDLSSLLHRRLLFRRIDCAKPRIHLLEREEAHVSLLNRLLTVSGETEPTGQGFGGWFSQTLALRRLELHDGEIVYVREPNGSPLVLTRTEASLAYTPGEGIMARFSAAFGHSGGMGKVALQTFASKWETHAALDQVEWQGKVHLSGLLVHQLGRLLGAEWPQMTLDLSGHYQGKGVGPVELTGEVGVGDAQIGSVRVSGGKAKLTKLLWPGQAGASFALPSILRALVVEAQIEGVRGEIGESNLPVVLHKGNLTLRDEELAATGIMGTYGTKSQITEGGGTLKHLFSGKGPVLNLHLVVDLDLEEGLGSMLAAPAGTKRAFFSQHLTQPRGRALVQLGLRAPGPHGAIMYNGEVVLQQAAFHAPTWNVDVTDLTGTVRLSKESLTADALALRVGQSWIQVQGSIRDYLSPQRSVDLHLTFTAVRDHDLAPLLPQGMILSRRGSLSGQIDVVLPPESKEVQTAGKVTLSRVRLDLLSFLRPLEVVDGEVRWQGQSGAFVVRQGRLPGGDFTGRGQFRSLDPVDIEVSADFADLDLESALVLDIPTAEDSKSKNTAAVVRADLTCGRLTYKTIRAEDLRLSCHWHDRQADLHIPEARAAGGRIQGEAVLWPDHGAMFIAPRLTHVDVLRFFSALGNPTDVLTGTLSGGGEIYVPDWRKWAKPAVWDGTLTIAVADGVAQRVPILVRLWSALSLQGLLSLQFPSLPSEGLAFSSLSGDFTVGKGLAVTNNLSLKGSAVQIDAHGQIDLARRQVNLKTALVPLHGITGSVARVPLAGELLARGADRLTTLSLRVSGPYDDPSVTPLLVDTGKP